MIFSTIFDFYHGRGGELSGESDLGVMWRDGADFPRYRVSIMHNTGDVYAINHQSGQVELLAAFDPEPLCHAGAKHLNSCVYETVERLVPDWAEHNDLAWLREKLAG